MEGLEAAEGSSTGSSDDSEDDDHEDAPGTSGRAAVHGKMAVMVGRWQPTLLPVFRARNLVHALSRLKSFRTQWLSLSRAFWRTQELSQERHLPGSTMRGRQSQSQKQRRPEQGRKQSLEPTEKGQETGVIGEDRAAMALSRENRKSVPAANPEGSNSGDTALGLEAVDMSAFGSAAELESLGLERLKCELMALGLKCGHTLQERAAILFSVRGLSKQLIDPALFAKPSKGQK